MSNLSCGNSSEEVDETLNVLSSTSDGSSAHQEQALPSPNKKRRKLPGNPDPRAEVIALSPRSLMATNRFICEVCNKGFQREQNLQLHRRGHNLPWKLKQKTSNEIKKRVYICPEISCIHHNPARALGDLTGIKKHFSRKHIGEKKWKCDKCSKKYAVQSDWKAHSKTCGTKEYKCDCGTIFSRRDSFVTHRAFCDALAEENNKVNQVLASNTQLATTGTGNTQLTAELISNTSMLNLLQINNSNMAGSMFSSSSGFNQPSTNSSNMSSSATLLLQQAAQMGATMSSSNMNNSPINVVRKSCYTSPFNGMQIPIIRTSDHDHIQAQIGSNNIVHGFVGSMLQNSVDDDHQKTSRLVQNEAGWYNNTNNNTLLSENQMILNEEAGHSNEDDLTLDFLGIRGMRQRNLHEIMYQQQEMSNFEQQKEVSSQQSIQGENSMWDD